MNTEFERAVKACLLTMENARGQIEANAARALATFLHYFTLPPAFYNIVTK